MSQDFTVNSLTVNVEVIGKLGLGFKLVSLVEVGFELDLTGFVNYQYSNVASTSVVVLNPPILPVVLRDFQAPALLTAAVEAATTDRSTATADTSIRLISGSEVIISFQYQNYNPNETTVLLYAIETGDTRLDIMMKEFNTSSSGSGVFDAAWTVPWYLSSHCTTSQFLLSLSLYSLNKSNLY